MIGDRFIGLHKRQSSLPRRKGKLSAGKMCLLGLAALLAIVAIAWVV